MEPTMPLIRIQISKTVDEALRAELMTTLSKTVAGALGKPESYVMVIFESGVAMKMGGTDEPAAFADIRSVGSISADQARSLSTAVCEVVGKAGIDTRRIYANFAGVPGAMWGHGGNTFG